MRIGDWNGLDWVLAGVVVFSVAAGFRRGLVRTVLGLAGYAGGFMLAWWKYVRVGDVIIRYGWIKSPTTARAVAYLLIVAAVVIAVEVMARLMHRTVSAVGLGLMNRMLGAGFGLLRGGIAGMALLLIPASFAPRSRLMKTSVLSPCFFAAAHDVSFVLPEYLEHMTLRKGLNF